MKKLYRFFWECGRQGDVTGMFIAEEKDIKNIIGEEVYFGEILGKHSEIHGTIEEGEMTEIKVSDITLKEMEEVLGSDISGYNPLHYVRYKCSRCGDRIRFDECDWYINTNEEKICGGCVIDGEEKNLKLL